MHTFFKCKDKKWDGGIQILWAKSVKWRQIRARWGDFGGQTRDLWAKPSGGFEKNVHFLSQPPGDDKRYRLNRRRQQIEKPPYSRKEAHHTKESNCKK